MRFGKWCNITPTWGSIRISKNKFFEWQLEFSRFNNDPFELSLRWTSRQDHAGFDFIFSIYKLFWLNINIHDRRHWDYEKNKWQEPDDCGYEENRWE